MINREKVGSIKKSLDVFHSSEKRRIIKAIQNESTILKTMVPFLVILKFSFINLTNAKHIQPKQIHANALIVPEYIFSLCERTVLKWSKV